MIETQDPQWENLDGTEYWQIKTPHGFLTTKEPCKNCITNGPSNCDSHKHLFND